jgi:hypothetical protein
MQVNKIMKLKLIVAISVATLSCENESKKQPELSILDGINPPVENAIPFESIKFDADSGCIIKRLTGMQIDIPPGSIVDANGLPISGEVELKVREFHSAEEILMSGISMQYNSDKNELLSSGGMFELRANKNGTSVHLKKNSSISINLPSQVELDSDYQLFKFEEDKAWGEGTSFNRTQNTEIQSLIAKTDSIITGKNRVFSLKADFYGRADLIAWEDVEWEMLKCNSELEFEKTKDLIWEYITIEQIGNSSNFELNLSSTLYWNNGNERRWDAKIIAQPKLSQTELDERLELQANEDKRLKLFFQKAQKENKEFAARYEQERKEWIKEAEKERKRAEERAAVYQRNLSAQNQLMSSFRINSFGIYNIDKIITLKRICNKEVTIDSSESSIFDNLVHISFPASRTVIQTYFKGTIPVYSEKYEIYFTTYDGEMRKINHESMEKLKRSTESETEPLKLISELVSDISV